MHHRPIQLFQSKMLNFLSRPTLKSLRPKDKKLCIEAYQNFSKERGEKSHGLTGQREMAATIIPRDFEAKVFFSSPVPISRESSSQSDIFDSLVQVENTMVNAFNIQGSGFKEFVISVSP